jgi:outer membrane lipoprotein LolB
MKHGLHLLMLLALSGCGLIQVSEHNERIATLTQLSHWDIQGKVSLRNPEDSATGLLSWEQQNDRYSITISGPFGQGTTRIEGRENHSSLSLPGWQQPRQAANASLLMQDTLGWQFPVEDLSYWVKGIPSPHTESTHQLDDYGLISSIRQHDWTIEFKRYSQHQGQWLPGLIKLQGYDQKITLAINRWNIH